MFLLNILYILTSFHMIFVKLQENSTTAVGPDKELSSYDWAVWCKLQPNGNDCAKRLTFLSRFYYDVKLQDCKTFSYGRCVQALNNFNTLSECHDNCGEPGLQVLKGNFSNKAKCRFQPDFGDCNEYYPMFYYDIVQRACIGFSYSGCGGNENRFANAQTCAAVCTKLMEAEVN